MKKTIRDNIQTAYSLHDMNVGFEERNRIICFTKKL